MLVNSEHSSLPQLPEDACVPHSATGAFSSATPEPIPFTNPHITALGKEEGDEEYNDDLDIEDNDDDEDEDYLLDDDVDVDDDDESEDMQEDLEDKEDDNDS